MKLTSRPFDDVRHDFEKLYRFLQQDYCQRGEGFVWLFSRLGDWKYGLYNEQKYIPSFFRKHAHLWVDSFDDLLGFVLSEDGGNIFFIFTRVGCDFLYAEILDWTVRHWGPRYPSLKTEVHELQTGALAELESSGFRSLGVVATTRRYDLRSRPIDEVVLESGFQIVDLAENGDFYHKGLLYKNGFSDQDSVSNLDLLTYDYSRESPAYDAHYDFSAVTESGLHVATCVGFNDPLAGIAEVEKICTHSQYRRRGLAEAVVRHCFNRLRERGIKTAYITGYSGEANGLYEKLGPCANGYKRWFHYELGSLTE